MTLKILLITSQKSKKVRALLDSGSQKSYILKTTAEELGLRFVLSETVAHTLFRNAQTKAELHNKFQIAIRGPSKRQQNKLIFEFLNQERICESIPRILKELNMNRLWISDLSTGSPEIKILI